MAPHNDTGDRNNANNLQHNHTLVFSVNQAAILRIITKAMCFIVLSAIVGTYATLDLLEKSLDSVNTICDKVSETNPLALSTPYVASAVQLQRLRGLNASIWNLEQMANLGIISTLEVYTNLVRSEWNNTVIHYHSKPLMRFDGDTKISIMNITPELEEAIGEVYLNGDITRFEGNEELLLDFITDSSDIAKAKISIHVRESYEHLERLSRNGIPKITLESTLNCRKEYRKLITKACSSARAAIILLAVIALPAIIFYVLQESSIAQALCSIKCFHIMTDEDRAATPTMLCRDDRRIICFPKKTTRLKCFISNAIQHSFFSGATSWILYIALSFALYGLIGMFIIQDLEHYGATRSFEITIEDQLYDAYSQFERNLNMNSHKLVATLVRRLEKNHAKFLNSMERLVNYPIQIPSPFAAGVASELISFPFPFSSDSKLNHSYTADPSATMSLEDETLKGSKRIVEHFWRFSWIFFSTWLIFSGILCILCIQANRKHTKKYRELSECMEGKNK